MIYIEGVQIAYGNVTKTWFFLQRVMDPVAIWHCLVTGLVGWDLCESLPLWISETDHDMGEKPRQVNVMWWW